MATPKVAPMQAATSPLGQALGGMLGGVAGSSQQPTQTIAPTTNTTANPNYQMRYPGTLLPIQQSFSTFAFSATSTGYGQTWGFGKKIHHTTPSADAFKSLTAYIRKLLACEENCECKWCTAT